MTDRHNGKPIMQRILSSTKGAIVAFTYTNYKGVTRNRRVDFHSVDLIYNEHYPEGAICLTGLDLDKGQTRSFDIKKIEAATFHIEPRD